MAFTPLGIEVEGWRMVCGIDIGGTKIEMAVYDGSLRKLHSRRVATPVHDYVDFLRTLTELIRSADRLADAQQVVGLALPGLLDHLGLANSTNIPCINRQAVLADIQRSVGRKVIHDNDARAFTLSESRGGALDGVSVGLGLVLGTGVAGALCIQGRVFTSSKGVAGEYGHVPLPVNLLEKHNLPASQCVCGVVGCAKQFLSGPGLVQIGSIFGGGYTTAEQLLEDACQLVPAATRGLTAYIDCLGYFVSRLGLLFDPDVIVLGGGLSNAAPLYGQLPDAVAAYLFDGVEPPSIAAPRFGASGGVRGAAILALESRVQGTSVRRLRDCLSRSQEQSGT